MSADAETAEPTRPRRRAPLIAGSVAFVVVLLIVLLAQSPRDDQRQDAAPLVGRVAPTIVATDTTGAKFDLASLRGGWVLVNFFATWCAPCKLEQPELVQWATSHAGSSGSIVSVSFNDQPAAVRDFFRANGGDWPVIAEGNAQIALDYGVIKLPESYLVAPSGVIVDKFSGGVRASELDAVISRLDGQK